MPAEPEQVRFGPFEVNFTDGELRKHGARLRIQSKPLSVLHLLVSNQGKVVTREELRKALWHDDVFVDFEKNLTTAVNKLRETLSDTAEEARYIETLPRKGYRFTVAVERIIAPQMSPAPVQPAASQLQPPAQPDTRLPAKAERKRLGRALALAASGLLLVAAAGALLHR